LSADNQLLIERREYKYLITPELADRVREAVRPFCKLDPFAAKQGSSSYIIDSLYFDNLNMALYWANEHETMDRFKLRIRSYPQVPTGPKFFEVKRRFNDVISKSRGRVGCDDWLALMKDPGCPIPDNVRPMDRRAVERFLTLTRLHQAEPKTIVRYEREPYMSLVDDYARVTFDRNIRCQRAEFLDYEPKENGWRNMDFGLNMMNRHSLVVLELKFTSAVPTWMVNTVASLGLTRYAFSKYATSVAAWYTSNATRVPCLETNPQ
jgi:SPX domain protein involved in polyphosphate accumulation